MFPATGHSLSEWETIENPNCTEAGTESRHCIHTDCTYKEDRTLPALGHDWDDGNVTEQPSESAEGSITYTCKRCHTTKTQTLPKLTMQEIEFAFPGDMTIRYGEFEYVYNDAYNDSENGGALTYKSSDETVATVNESGKVKIIGVGETYITATAAAIGSYFETSVRYKLTVLKAPLTVKPMAVQVYYAESAVIDGFTATGFVFDEDETVLSGQPIYQTAYKPMDTVGTYEITMSGLSADNYDIQYEKGVLTVAKAVHYTVSLGNLSQRKDSITPVTATVEPIDPSAVIKIEYKTDENSWSEVLPDEIGLYEVRASLVAANNIQADVERFTYATLEIKAGAIIGLDGNETIGVRTDVNGNQAEFTVKDEDVQKLLEHVPSTGEVVINAKGSTEGVCELILPANIMDAVSNSEKVRKFTVLADDAEISMDTGVLDTVADKLQENDKVSVHIESVDKEKLTDKQQSALSSIGGDDAVVLQLNLVVSHFDGDGNPIGEDLHELGGNVNVRAAYTMSDDMIGKRILVCYVANDGSVSYVRAKYEDGYVSFSTTHFSYFALLSVTHLFGDLDSNGILDVKDNMILARYLAGWDGYDPETFGFLSVDADVNADGSITVEDNMILARHLAGWDGYETLPYKNNKNK